MNHAKDFFDKYRPDSIVEIGSLTVCGGAMRDVAPAGVPYTGLDMVEGESVDELMTDPYKIPLMADVADAVVSTSTFEHVEFFWLLFLEMVRVTKVGGLVYINAPSNGPFHRHPVDCWRFYLDSGEALARWANRNGYRVEVVECFIGEPDGGQADGWRDFVCVWRKM